MPFIMTCSGKTNMCCCLINSSDNPQLLSEIQANLFIIFSLIIYNHYLLKYIEVYFNYQHESDILPLINIEINQRKNADLLSLIFMICFLIQLMYKCIKFNCFCFFFSVSTNVHTS